MANQLLPDELWNEIASLFPVRKPECQEAFLSMAAAFICYRLWINASVLF